MNCNERNERYKRNERNERIRYAVLKSFYFTKKKFIVFMNLYKTY